MADPEHLKIPQSVKAWNQWIHSKITSQSFL